MKKNLFFATLFCFTAVLTSCKTVHQVLADRKFDKSTGINELNREPSNDSYPLTLDFDGNYGCPTVKYTLNGVPLFFCVDTGAASSTITDSGLRKLGYDVTEFQNKLLPSFAEYIQTEEEIIGRLNSGDKKTAGKIRKKMLRFFKAGGIFHIQIDGKSWDYGLKFDSKIDGFLGEDFLRQYKTVTFDFKNNLLLLDAPKIEKNIIPFEITEFSHLVININYKGNAEPAIIDTGNYTFSPRNDFGKNTVQKFDYSQLTSKGFIENYKIRKKAPFIHSFSEIKIGEEEFNGIKGIYSTVWFSTYTKTAQIYLQYISGLGCEFFRDRILQIDYENMEISL